MYPELSSESDLVRMLSAIRRYGAADRKSKVLIVLDQFEQWLHKRAGDFNTTLLQALRQCDGSRLACVVIVRDDFWLGVSRFLQQLTPVASNLAYRLGQDAIAHRVEMSEP